MSRMDKAVVVRQRSFVSNTAPADYAGKTYYQILDVAENATILEINKAYKLKVREAHPDKDFDIEDAQEFRALQEAKETLLNPELKEMYDSQGCPSYDDSAWRE